MTITLSESNIHHPDYAAFSEIWTMIRDSIAGKKQIDIRGEIYLPIPNLYDDARYTAYQTRAVWYGATGKTLDGYLGAIFRKPAQVELPEGLEYLLKDTDGEGNNLSQFSKAVARDVIPMGRKGVLVDYPKADGVVTLEDEINSDMKARFLTYTPESIVNWATCRKGSKTVLTSVLLKEESAVVSGHAFSREVTPVYRMLDLDEQGHYVQRKMVLCTEEDREGNEITTLQERGETTKPLLPGGIPMDYIPFMFIGSETFTPAPDLPPLYDIAQLNVAHYRNSADHQQAVFAVGQPTPWISGLDNTFIENNKGQLVIGSNACWLLPDGAVAGMLESKTNKGMILESMQHLEIEMVGIGARIIQDNTSKGSEATESVMMRRSGESSQLACIADNISEAMEILFRWAGAWMGISESELENIKFQLNKDFFGATLPPQQITALVGAWQGGAISHEVLLNNFRKGEIISELKSNEEVLDEIESEPPPLGTLTLGGEQDLDSDGE